MLAFILTDGQIERFFWARPVSTAALISAFIAVFILTIFLYRRRQGLPFGLRMVLAFFRLLALSFIVAALFEPSVTIEKTYTEKRRLPVLVDVSKSMSIKDQRKRSEDVGEAALALGILPFSSTMEDLQQSAVSLAPKQLDAIASASRLDLATNLLSKSAADMLGSITSDLDVSYYAFGDQLRRLGEGNNKINTALAALQPNSPESSIGEALEVVAKTERGAPLAGVVLVSDGLDTSSRRSESVVRDLGTRGIPVYTVPIGITDPDDVSIRNVIMQDVAFTGDKVPIRVQLQSKGYEKRVADLTVSLNGRGVARQSVSLEGLSLIHI